MVSLAFHNNIFEECCRSIERQAGGRDGAVRLAVNRRHRKPKTDVLGNKSIRISGHVVLVVSGAETVCDIPYVQNNHSVRQPKDMGSTYHQGVLH
jgi:hypothetical protein